MRGAGCLLPEEPLGTPVEKQAISCNWCCYPTQDRKARQHCDKKRNRRPSSGTGSISKTKGVPNPESAADACDCNPYKSPQSRQICKQDAARHPDNHKNPSGCKKKVSCCFYSGRKIWPWFQLVVKEPRDDEIVQHDGKDEGVWVKCEVHIVKLPGPEFSHAGTVTQNNPRLFDERRAPAHLRCSDLLALITILLQFPESSRQDSESNQ